jgi:hypothetical protein
MKMKNINYASTGFKNKDGNLSDIKVNKMPELVGDKGSEVPASNAMPSPVIVILTFILVTFIEYFNI